MSDLTKSNYFYNGLICGINLYQQKIVMAHERREGILIGDTLYYIQDGRERLMEAIEKMCE